MGFQVDYIGVFKFYSPFHLYVDENLTILFKYITPMKQFIALIINNRIFFYSCHKFHGSTISSEVIRLSNRE